MVQHNRTHSKTIILEKDQAHLQHFLSPSPCSSLNHHDHWKKLPHPTNYTYHNTLVKKRQYMTIYFIDPTKATPDPVHPEAVKEEFQKPSSHTCVYEKSHSQTIHKLDNQNMDNWEFTALT
jgi:hypothetical protein